MSTVQVRAIFDSNAEEFDAWFGKNRELYLSELLALRAAGPRGKTLDIGVGSGVFASKLGVALGIDVSRKVLELSKKRELKVLLADVKRIPVKAEAFDSVVVSFTICFVDDPLGMLKEAHRVLKKDGRLILGEITLDSEWGRFYSQEGKEGHPFYSQAKFFTLGETLSMLSESGFSYERAFGTVSYGPTDKPRVEKPTALDIGDEPEARRHGFVCLRALKK